MRYTFLSFKSWVSEKNIPKYMKNIRNVILKGVSIQPIRSCKQRDVILATTVASGRFFVSHYSGLRVIIGEKCAKKVDVLLLLRWSTNCNSTTSEGCQRFLFFLPFWRFSPFMQLRSPFAVMISKLKSRRRLMLTKPCARMTPGFRKNVVTRYKMKSTNTKRPSKIFVQVTEDDFYITEY